MNPLERPEYWIRQRPHGVQYVVKQLHFPSRDIGLEWVKGYFPGELQAASDGWADDAPRFDHNIWADIPAPAPAASSQERIAQLEGERDAGLNQAIAFVQKRLRDYVDEHGSTDPETGTVEFPGNGDEAVCEWEEIIEGLEALRGAKS